jgi:hypothetical protein
MVRIRLPPAKGEVRTRAGRRAKERATLERRIRTWAAWRKNAQIAGSTLLRCSDRLSAGNTTESTNIRSRRARFPACRQARSTSTLSGCSSILAIATRTIPETRLLQPRRGGSIGIVAISVQATGAPAFAAASSGGRLGSQCTSKKAPPGDAAGRIRHQPVKRRRHDCRLDHFGAVVAGLESTMPVLVTPPGTSTLTVTPVPARSLAMIAEKASKAAFDLTGHRSASLRGSSCRDSW